MARFRPRLILAAAIAFPALAASLREARAARVLVDDVPLTQVPRWMVATSAGNFVVTASTASDIVEVFDARFFQPVLPFPDMTLGSSGTARSITSAPVVPSQVGFGLSGGSVSLFDLGDIITMADGGNTATPVSTFQGVPSPDPASAVAISFLGDVFVGDQAAKTVTVWNRSTNPPTELTAAPILLGHTPLTGLDVPITNERVYFGSDDGFLSWISTFPPFTFSSVGASQVAAAGHHLNGLAFTVSGGVPQLFVTDRDAQQLLSFNAAGPSALFPAASLAGPPVGVAVTGSYDTVYPIIWVAEEAGASGKPELEAFTDTLTQAQPPVVLPAPPVSIFEALGYLYVGLADGSLAIVTDRPWITIQSLSPTWVSTTGQSLTVTYASNQAGPLNAFVNDTPVASGNAVVGSGQTLVITPAEMSFLASQQGTETLRLEVTAAGLVGHAEDTFLYSLPPSPPQGFSVGFANGAVIGSWQPPASANAASYLVSFGTDSAGTIGVPNLSSPQTTTYTGYTVYVSNGTTVYMSVVAVNSQGQISASTPVLHATAQPTAGAADLAGDKGGFSFFCSVALGRGTLGASWAGLLLLTGAWLFRRRRA